MRHLKICLTAFVLFSFALGDEGVQIKLNTNEENPAKVRIIGNSKTTIETTKGSDGSTQTKLLIRPARHTPAVESLNGTSGPVELGLPPKLNARFRRTTPLVSFVIPEELRSTTPSGAPRRHRRDELNATEIPAEVAVTAQSDTDNIDETVAPLGAKKVSLAPLLNANETVNGKEVKNVSKEETSTQSVVVEPTTVEMVVATTIKAVTTKKVAKVVEKSSESAESKDVEDTTATLKKVTVAVQRTGEEVRQSRESDITTPTAEVMKQIEAEGVVQSERIAEALQSTTTAEKDSAEEEHTTTTQKTTLTETKRIVKVEKHSRRDRRDTLAVKPNIGRQIEAEGVVQSERIAEALKSTTESSLAHETLASEEKTGVTAASLESVTLPNVKTAKDSKEVIPVVAVPAGEKDTMRDSQQRVEGVLLPTTDKSKAVVETEEEQPRVKHEAGKDEKPETLKDGTPTIDKPADHALISVLSDPKNSPPRSDQIVEPLNTEKLPSLQKPAELVLAQSTT
jgi:hypothetical protein